MKNKLACTALSIGLALSALTAGAAVGTITGPFTHRNLQIYLVHGHTQLESHTYATLERILTLPP